MKKVAIVTGGAQGIGLGIVERLMRDGYEIAVFDIEEAALEAAGSRFPGVRTIRTDISDIVSVQRSVKAVEDQFGRLDALVNSAGILGLLEGRSPTTEETPLELWQRVLAVNLTGTFLVCQACVPLMRNSGGGRIVNVASRAARLRSGNAAYSASKGGLLTFSRYLAGEVAPFGITVNCITPSRVETPMTKAVHETSTVEKKIAETPLGRIGTVEDMAGAVAFLLSKDASFMTGAILDVNGGSFMQ